MLVHQVYRLKVGTNGINVPLTAVNTCILCIEISLSFIKQRNPVFTGYISEKLTK